MMDSMTRRVEVWQDGDGGAWVPLDGGEAALAALPPGSIFRLFATSGAPVIGEGGETRWRVVSIGAPDATGEVAVETEPVLETAVEAAVAETGFWFPGDTVRGMGGGPPRRLR